MHHCFVCLFVFQLHFICATVISYTVAMDHQYELYIKMSCITITIAWLLCITTISYMAAKHHHYHLHGC